MNFGYTRVRSVTPFPLSALYTPAPIKALLCSEALRLDGSEPKIGRLIMSVRECRYCNNCGGKWIRVTVLRKRTFIFKPCPHCQKGAGRKTGQLTLLDLQHHGENP